MTRLLLSTNEPVSVDIILFWNGCRITSNPTRPITFWSLNTKKLLQSKWCLTSGKLIRNVSVVYYKYLKESVFNFKKALIWFTFRFRWFFIHIFCFYFRFLQLSTELRNANATSHIHSLCAWNYTCERNSSRIPEKILVVDGNCRNIQPAGGTYDCETLYAVFPVKTGDNNCDRVTWDKWPVGCMAVERRTLPA